VAALSEKINHYFQHQPELQRNIFEKIRQTISLPAVVGRRAAAREIARDASFTIRRDTGFVVFPPERFPEAAEIVAATRHLGVNVDLTRPGLSKKARAGFMVPMLDPATLDLSSPLLRFVTRPDIIAAVSDYLGMVPVLSHLNVYYSSANGNEHRQSQLFHCDADATSQIKIFLLCTEVTPAQGPLTLLDARTSDAVRQRLGYHFGRKVKDRQVAPVADESSHHPVLGPPGTTCFVDTTRCFHFGSRVDAGALPRLVVMVQYLTPGSFMLPRDHRAGAPFRHLATPGLTRAQRLVLGAE
jgi:hypothetical protein